MAKVRVAVVLSGCGVFDGAEVHESVLTLLALDRAGAEVIVAAPDIQQAHVVNHQTGDVAAGEQRSVLAEAARIARGPVKKLSELSGADFDAIIFPGGFGAAKNLCTYAIDGPAMKVNADVERVTLDAVRAAKPIGTMCISPVMTSKILAESGFNVTVTIGNDAKTAAHIRGFDATHRDCAAGDIVVDEFTRVVSTPAYMLAGSIKEAAAGIEKLVKAVLEMCNIGK